jgi:predicted nucleic acid-binding protein
MMRAFFYDTWAFVALADERDAGHDVAAQLDLDLELKGYAPVTTDYILDETVTHLSRDATPRVAIAFLDRLLARVDARELALLEINAERRTKACTVFKRLSPSTRQLSFTDTTSFVVMHELSITHAFTVDRHFHRAGRGVHPLVEKRPSGYAIHKLA